MVAGLWIPEGIPQIFSDCPAVYESLRTWLGDILSVDPKEITVTGSGRLGYSLIMDKFGDPFGENSDLDLFVVSNDLFSRMKINFELWLLRYQNGDAVPNEKEKNISRETKKLD